MKKHFLPRCFNILLLCTLVILSSSCGVAIPRISGTAYYKNCSKGDDANSGTSSSRPWHTVGKVNATVFAPGDEVFFKWDTTCPGGLL